MRQFTLDISYSQIAVFVVGLKDPFNDWTDAHAGQGFCWREGSVSFVTAAKTGKGKVSIVRTEQAALAPDAILAFSVPFTVTNKAVEIASVTASEVVDIDDGDYELVYQTGKTGVTPWATLQFIPGKVTTARILKGAELLKPPAELLMTAEPA